MEIGDLRKEIEDAKWGKEWCGKADEMFFGWLVLTLAFASGVVWGTATQAFWATITGAARLCLYGVVALTGYSLGMDKGYEKHKGAFAPTDLDRDYRRNPVWATVLALVAAWWEFKWKILGGLAALALIGYLLARGALTT